MVVSGSLSSQTKQVSTSSSCYFKYFFANCGQKLILKIHEFEAEEINKV